MACHTSPSPYSYRDIVIYLLLGGEEVGGGLLFSSARYHQLNSNISNMGLTEFCLY